MGQATIDLSDPLDQSKTADAASADDLLSQLAGEEIDRLLAEADAKPGKVAEEQVIESPAVDAQVAHVEKTAERGAKIDAVRAHAEAPKPVAKEVAPATPTTVAAAPAPEIESETNAAERAALAAPVTELRPTDATDESSEQNLPLYLKPLEWLNAPLMLCPEPVRELLGKVAIITLLNAIAVLIYVVVFRTR